MIGICSDHAGFELKSAVMAHLRTKGIEVKDFGTYSTGSCDYPDFALPAAEAVASGKCEKGIVVCSTGIGVSIVANKVPGVRCAHCHDSYCAEFTRLHNDANVLALGEKVIGVGYALKIVNTFLNTEFEGGRHQRRVDKITEIEKKIL